MVVGRAALPWGLLVIGLATAGCGGETPASSSDVPEPAGSPPSSAPAAPIDALQVLRETYADATDGAADLAWAPRVSVSYAGSPGITLSAARADDPTAWEGCPASQTEYAARRCPVSPLATIEAAVADGVEIVHEDEAPTYVGCDRPEPPDAPAGRVISVRPDEDHRDCFSDFAVNLYLDQSGRVATVDFVLSSP